MSVHFYSSGISALQECLRLIKPDMRGKVLFWMTNLYLQRKMYFEAYIVSLDLRGKKLKSYQVTHSKKVLGHFKKVKFNVLNRI